MLKCLIWLNVLISGEFVDLIALVRALWVYQNKCPGILAKGQSKKPGNAGFWSSCKQENMPC